MANMIDIKDELEITHHFNLRFSERVKEESTTIDDFIDNSRKFMGTPDGIGYYWFEGEKNYILIGNTKDRLWLTLYDASISRMFNLYLRVYFYSKNGVKAIYLLERDKLHDRIIHKFNDMCSKRYLPFAVTKKDKVIVQIIEDRISKIDKTLQRDSF